MSIREHNFLWEMSNSIYMFLVTKSCAHRVDRLKL